MVLMWSPKRSLHVDDGGQVNLGGGLAHLQVSPRRMMRWIMGGADDHLVRFSLRRKGRGESELVP